MDRITIGAPLGGAAVYILDPQRGEDRRRRVQSFWRENRDTAFEVGGGLSQAAESVRPMVRRVKRGFGRGGWTEGGGPNWVPGVTGIIIAAALGGVPLATVVNEYVAHERRGNGEKMAFILPLDLSLLAEPQVHLVHERGGLQGVILPLAGHVVPGQTPQLLIHDRGQLIEGCSVSLAPGLQ